MSAIITPVNGSRLQICLWLTPCLRGNKVRDLLQQYIRLVEFVVLLQFLFLIEFYVIQQFFFLVRLAEIGINSQFLRIQTVFFSLARGDDNNRQVSEFGVIAQALGQLKTIHARHLDVQQHYRRRKFREFFQRIQTIFSGHHLIAGTD